MCKLREVLVLMGLLLLLVGCGKSEAAQAADQKIQAIGTVSLNSEASIIDAETAYSQLTDKEKQQLEYYQTLVDARTKYNKLFEEEQEKEQEKEKQRIQDMIADAYNKIEAFDMQGAYEIALALPDEYTEDKEKIIKKVDDSCYENTFFTKLEIVTSTLPKSTDKPQRALSGGITIGHEYADFNSMQNALNDYHKYLNTYYSPNDNTGLSYDEYNMSTQTYEFKDEKGHKIIVSGSNLFGLCYLNINVEEGVNYRDVIETTEE